MPVFQIQAKLRCLKSASGRAMALEHPKGYSRNSSMRKSAEACWNRFVNSQFLVLLFVRVPHCAFLNGVH
jgi:hypothetical protein